MGDAGKQLTSLARHAEEARNAIGVRFQNAFSLGVRAVTDLLILVQKYPDAFITAAQAITVFSLAIVGMNSKLTATGILTVLTSAAFGKAVLITLTLVGAYKLASSALEVLNRKEQKNLDIKNQLAEFERGKAAGLKREELATLAKTADEESRLFDATKSSAELFKEKIDATVQAKAGGQNRQLSEQLELQAKFAKELRDADPANRALIEQRQQRQLIDFQRNQYFKLYDDVKDHAAHAFDAIFTGSKKGFAGLVDFIKGIWVTMLRKMFAELVAHLLTPLFARMSGLFGGAAGAGGGGFFGNLFGGFANILGGRGGGGLLHFAGGGGGGGIAGLFGGLGGGGRAGGGGLLGRVLGLAGIGTATAPLALGSASLAALPSAALPASILAPATIGGTAGAAGLGTGLATIGGAGGSGLLGTIGALATNPITLIAAGALAGVLLFLKFRGGREEKFRKEILRDFGINVPDKKLLQMIKQIGEARFGGLADRKRHETLRLDDVQAMLLNYAQLTGQDPSRLPIWQRFHGRGLTPGPLSFDQAKGIEGESQARLRPSAFDVVTSSPSPVAAGAPGAAEASPGLIPAFARGGQGVTVNISFKTEFNGVSDEAKITQVIRREGRELTRTLERTLKGDFARTGIREALT